MSFSEFHLAALEKRNLALNQKRFAIKMKQDAIILRDKMNAILFGDTDNYGVVSVIQQYYKLIQLGTGITTRTPSFADPQTTKNQYTNQFALSVTVPGDGPGGIHPPDPQVPSMGTDKPDQNSVWLTDFSIEASPTAVGIVQRLTELLTIIGTEASQNADYRGSYTQLATAQQAVAAQKGSGILGARTENSELNTNVVGSNTTYSIGRSGLDAPDSFPSKTQFLTALDNVISALTAWKNQSATIRDTLNGAKSDIIVEYKIELPSGDIEALNTSIGQAENFLQNIQDFISYFDGFSGTTSANRAAFNTKLKELKSYVDTIPSSVNERCGAIPALMGTVSAGLKKYLAFWVKDITKKPDGPYALLSTADDMIANSNANMQEQNDKLNFFDQDKTRWIMTPKLALVYDDPILDLDKSVKEKRITLVWEPVMSANKYCILIKPFSSVKGSMTNDFWQDAESHWITEKNPETGMLQNTLNLPAPEEPVIARMTAYDSNEGETGDFERMDSADTHSIQTNIVSDELPFTQLENVGGATVLSIDESYKIREQQRIWINHSTLATVFSISENNVQLDRNYNTVEAIQQIFGLYVPIGYSDPEED